MAKIETILEEARVIIGQLTVELIATRAELADLRAENQRPGNIIFPEE